MRTIDERFKELIDKYNNSSNNNIIIIIRDDKDNIISNLDTLFSIGKNRLFKDIEKAVKKFNSLLTNKIVKSRMKNSYRFELVVNDIVEMVIYKAIPMSYEIYEKMKKIIDK